MNLRSHSASGECDDTAPPSSSCQPVLEPSEDDRRDASSFSPRRLPRSHQGLLQVRQASPPLGRVSSASSPFRSTPSTSWRRRGCRRPSRT